MVEDTQAVDRHFHRGHEDAPTTVDPLLGERADANQRGLIAMYDATEGRRRSASRPSANR
ncbi:MAG: hypothetical protein AMJ93_00510 [Anaerolineae bacterium SM23_84]|nr:MAG: hypothetical protein AMJ93_00510 [Anaerolineae bacterium SM23_84]